MNENVQNVLFKVKMSQFTRFLGVNFQNFKNVPVKKNWQVSCLIWPHKHKHPELNTSERTIVPRTVIFRFIAICHPQNKTHGAVIAKKDLRFEDRHRQNKTHEAVIAKDFRLEDRYQQNKILPSKFTVRQCLYNIVYIVYIYIVYIYIYIADRKFSPKGTNSVSYM